MKTENPPFEYNLEDIKKIHLESGLLKITIKIKF